MHNLRQFGRHGLLLLFLFVLFAAFHTATVHADAYSDVVDGLNTSGTYITPHPPAGSRIRAGDIQRLRAQVTNASNLGVDEDIAIVSSYPPNFHSTQEAASSLLNFLDFDGVLILVAPQGIALSSDQLTDSEDNAIARQVTASCGVRGWTTCALQAARLAVAKDRADKNSAFRDALVFWTIFFIGLAILIVIAIVALRIRRRGRKSPLGELRRAAEATLVELDDSLRTNDLANGRTEDMGQEPESVNGAALDAEVPTRVGRITQLRERAHTALETTSERALVQANEDAAEALLLARDEFVKDPNSTTTPTPRRCLYCAREDRPPYAGQTVEDGRGHAMHIEICSSCQAQLTHGQTPTISSVMRGSDPVPWWVTSDPWRAHYGGSSWQYWLPFLIGMDVAGWFRGSEPSAPLDPRAAEQQLHQTSPHP